jgi:pyridoxamine 5'-phosphate oxidase
LPVKKYCGQAAHKMSTRASLRTLRHDRAGELLLRRHLAHNPFVQFGRWLDEVVATELPQPNAMTLATSTTDGKPSARTVLLRHYDRQGFVFFSNYLSQKGRELAENPNATLLFFWTEPVFRQVRVAGIVGRISNDESDAYFASRPRPSQLGAWASKQSEVIPERATLDQRFENFRSQFRNKEIPRPANWGGFRLSPTSFEFWQGGENRLHNRFRYSLQPDQRWLIERLSP